MPAHGAEIGVHIEIFIVKRARRVGIEAEFELPLPVERGAGAGEIIIPIARARNAEGDIGGMRGDFISDAALFDVFGFWQPEMLFGRDITEHRGAMISGRRRADRARDMIVTGEDIGDERTEDIEGRAVADRALELHIVFDLIEGDVAGAFHHHLDTLFPSPLRELSECEEFGELGAIACIGEPTRTEAIAEAEAHVVSPHYIADRIKRCPHGIFGLMMKHPFGE